MPKMTPADSERFPEMNNIIVQLLFNRGLKDKKAIDDFLNPNYDEQVLDPFLFKDMNKAVDRIFAAVAKKQKVMVYGDYDADGVCASTILYQTFRSLGLDTDIYIPFRETEGYGLNKEIARQIIKQGFQLVVTVDCGISNWEEIEIFNEAGVDVIVTDHHQEPEKLPPALAIINPSVKDSGYPFSGLSGAGVAFKLAQAMIIRQNKDDLPLKLPAGFDKWLLDLTAIATVGDICDLLGENRVLVKYGLVVLKKTKRLGLKKMMAKINNTAAGIDTQYLGWRVVPRINAAGRVDHASVAFNLLNSRSEAEAERLVEILENNNRERQQITVELLKEAESQVEPELEKKKMLWVVGDNWPGGIVGLVAGRLADKYHRPALVISRAGDKYVGSGRSIEEFNITAALGEVAEFLQRFGGHSQACGFTVIGDDNFQKFKTRLDELAEKQLAGVDLRSLLEVEAEVELKDINWDLWEELEKFEPFGEGNPKPLFCVSGLIVESAQVVGADGRHLRVLASQESSPDIHKLIGFSFGGWCAKLKSGDKIDVVFDLGVNEWNGNRELQLKIVDLRLSE